MSLTTAENLNDSFNIFDESDWDFYANSDENFDMFGEYEDNFAVRPVSTAEKVVTGLQIGVFGLCTIGLCVYLYTTWSNRGYSINETVVDASAITYKTGTELESAEQIQVSRALSDYFNVYACNISLSMLDEYCSSGSKVYEAESSYRSKSSYSYDTNDCYAKAIKSFSRYVRLERVNKIVSSDGKVYAYATVSVPDTIQFSDYYRGYSKDLSYHFKSNDLTLINITKYILDLIEVNKVPTKSIELEFELKKENDRYLLVSDSAVKDYCIEPYITSISLISDILGEKIFT